MDTQRSFPLVGGPFDGQTNKLLADHAPEHLLLPLPAAPSASSDEGKMQVAVYLREPTGDGADGPTYRYRHSETRPLGQGETLR